MNNVLYAKYNSLRRPEFQLATFISEVDGRKYVTKKPQNIKAREHLDRIKKNYDIISGFYNRIKPVSYVEKNDGIEFEFINGVSVLKDVDFESDTIEIIVKKINEVIDVLLDAKEEYRTSFEVTKEFSDLFKEIEPETGIEAFSVCNLDSIFSNFVVCDDEIVCIDYEWVIDVPVPVNYIKYRMLLYLYNEEASYLSSSVDLPNYFNLFGFKDSEVECYRQMEEKFQEYVHGTDKRYSYLNNYTKAVCTLKDLQEDRDKLAELSKELSKAVEMKDAHIQNVEKIVDMKETHIQSVEKIVDMKETHIQNIEKKLKELNDTLELTIKQKDEYIDGLKKNIDDLKGFIEGKDRDIAKLKYEIEEKNKTISVLNNIIFKLKASIKNPVYGAFNAVKWAGRKVIKKDNAVTPEESNIIYAIERDVQSVYSDYLEIAVYGWCFNKKGDDIKFGAFYGDEECEIEVTDILRQDVEDIYHMFYFVKTPGFECKIKIPLKSILGEKTLRLYSLGEQKEAIYELETKDFNYKHSIRYIVDHLNINKDNEISAIGWGFGMAPQEDIKKEAIILDIKLYSDGKDVSDLLDVKRIIRQDVNKTLLPEDEILAKTGFEIKWKSDLEKKYKLCFVCFDAMEEYDVDPAELKFEFREKDRHYLNLSDMLKSRDEMLLADDKLFIKKYGWKEYKERVKNRFKASDEEYDEYHIAHAASEEELEKEKTHKFDYEPKVSVVVPTYKTPKKYLIEMIESVLNQTYSNIELCIADGSEGDKTVEKVLKAYHDKDSRLVYKINDKNYGIAGNTNACLELANGDYIALLDHDDVLSLNAIYEVVKAINEDRDREVIYTDEDKIDENSHNYFGPAFKPDFNIDLLRSNNYICHFFVAKKTIVDEIKGFNSEFDGSQDYDFIFRCTEKAKKIYHIPKTVYQWRCHQNSVAGNPESKLYAYEAGRRAIEEHLKRVGQPYEKVERLPWWGLYRVTYPVIDNPKVSILIPNKDHIDDLEKCVNSILEKTTYDNYEIIIIENNSTEDDTFEYYKKLEENERITVIKWADKFNFSAINNYGVKN